MSWISASLHPLAWPLTVAEKYFGIFAILGNIYSPIHWSHVLGMTMGKVLALWKIYWWIKWQVTSEKVPHSECMNVMSNGAEGAKIKRAWCGRIFWFQWSIGQSWMIELLRGLAGLANRRPQIKEVLEERNTLPTLSFEDTDLVMVNRTNWCLSMVEEIWRPKAS